MNARYELAPSTVTVAPVPSIVIGAVIDGKLDAKVIVPLSDPKLIVSPLSPFAVVIADLSVPAPESANDVTVIVAAPAETQASIINRMEMSILRMVVS